MSEEFMFFDTTPDDPREYPASQFAEYFSKFLTNGILNGGTNLQVSCPGTDMSVSIAPGYAWINGYLYRICGSNLSLTVSDADAANDRIDRIVLRLDTTLANRYIKAFVIKGTPAAVPEAPALVRNDNVYEISLAQVLVVAGRSYIDGTQITDERLDTSVCGLVNSLIQADTTDIFNQFQAWLTTKTAEFEDAWDAWFDGQKAGSGTYALQTDLTALENTVDTISTDLNTLDGDLDTHAAVVAGSTGLGHVKIGDAFTTGLELNSNTLRLTNRPQKAGGSVEYTDLITDGPKNVEKTIWTNRLHFPHRLLIVLLKNKSDPEKFIKYEIDPYGGSGFVTGINSNGKTITIPTTSTDTHGILSSPTDVGYGVASSGRVGIKVKSINSSGYIELTFSLIESGTATLNVEVDWMLV